MAKVIVLSNYGNWETDAIGLIMVADVEVINGEVAKDDLVRLAKLIAEPHVTEEELEDCETNQHLLDENETMEAFDGDCISCYSDLPMHYRTVVHFQSSINMYMLLHIIES